MDHRKFAKLEDATETARAKLAADPELRVVFCPDGEVPFEFGKQVINALRRAGVRIAVAMPEHPVALPPAKGAQATPPPGPQLIVHLTWSVSGDIGGIEIEGQKFAKADEILATLQTQAKAKPDLRILIRADRNVRYPFLKEVIAAAGKAGLKKVTLSVVNARPPVPVQ